MSKLRVNAFSVWVDGFGAGPQALGYSVKRRALSEAAMHLVVGR